MKLAGNKYILTVSILWVVLIMFSSCSQPQKQRQSDSNNIVFVKADASLKPTLLEVSENFFYMTSQKLQFQFVPAGRILSTNIESDSIDVYIFANEQFLTEGREAGLVDTTGDITLAYAVPCLIVPRVNPHLITSLSDLTNPQLRIGIADSSGDVLGAFSLELLKENGLLDQLNHRLITVGPTAMDLAAAVSKSQLDAAIAWTMSANWNPESFDVVLLNPGQVPRIAAITAIRSTAPYDSANADRLMTYLNSDRCREIFRNWGYLISESDVVMYAPAAVVGGKPNL